MHFMAMIEGGLVVFCVCMCDCVCFCLQQLLSIADITPPLHTHMCSIYPPPVNKSSFLCQLIRDAVCMCAHLCRHVCYLGSLEHSGGAALMGDGLSLLQIWKWPELYAVRLIYCVAFTEMMKQSLALTICWNTLPQTLIAYTHVCTHTRTETHKCIGGYFAWHGRCLDSDFLSNWPALCNFLTFFGEPHRQEGYMSLRLLLEFFSSKCRSAHSLAVRVVGNVLFYFLQSSLDRIIALGTFAISKCC